jgi:hypothetical protein
MSLTRIEFTEECLCQWAGMGNSRLVAPNSRHVVELTYEGEPPHGDSYHGAVVDGHVYPGYVWGCMFAFSSCSRYLAFSAMPTKFERRTAIVDMNEHRHFLLPVYIYQFSICWPSVIGEGALSEGKRYTFKGTEQWLAY